MQQFQLTAVCLTCSVKRMVLIAYCFFGTFTLHADLGWSLKNLTFQGGLVLNSRYKPLMNTEILFDHYRSSCLSRPRYYGLGINYYQNTTQTGVGLRGLWNPSDRCFVLNRRMKIYPFVSGQVGTTFQKTSDHLINNPNETKQNYYLRPGFGLNGSFRESRRINIRMSIQFGYDFYLKPVPNIKNTCILEIKTGLSWNMNRLKRHRYAS